MLGDAKAFSGFSVSDLDQARHFYGDILGIEVKDHSMGLLELHIKGSNHILVYPKPDHESATFTLLNFPVSDIDQAVDQLSEKGVQFEQYRGEIRTDHKGIRRADSRGPSIAWFRDPAGNILSVIEDVQSANTP